MQGRAGDEAGPGRAEKEHGLGDCYSGALATGGNLVFSWFKGRSDVTGLPDTSKIREAGRIREPEVPNGFHNTLMYKHSDGRALLFATSGPQAKIYDMDLFLGGDPKQGRIGQVPVLNAFVPGEALSVSRCRT